MYTACPDLPVVLVVVVVDEQPHDHGRHEAHGVAQRVDDAHERAGEVVCDVEHGALLARVDEAAAAHRHRQQRHRQPSMGAHKRGAWACVGTVSCKWVFVF